MQKLDLYVITSQATASRMKEMKVILDRLSRTFDARIQEIVDPDGGDLSREDLRKDVLIEKINQPVYDAQLRNLGAAQVSNALKHLEALRRIADGTRVGAYALVLEDDAVAGDDVCNDLQLVLDGLAQRAAWQIAMLGTGAGGATAEKGLVLLPQGSVLPVCNAYLVKPGLAARLASSMLPLRYCTNVHLSYVLDALGTAVLGQTPPVFVDGSKAGNFVSTLTQSNRLLFNADYRRAEELLEVGGEDPAREALQLLLDSPVAKHPDMMHLAARATHVCSGAEAARRIYEDALVAYEANGAQVSNESAMLRDYIRLFASLQNAA